MKKILALMLALTMAISLAACGGSEEVVEEVVEESVEETVEEAAEEAPEFDVTALVGSWTLIGATNENGEDDMEAVMEIYEGTFDMDIREDGTITWYTGIADFEGGVVEIADDGSAMMQFESEGNVLQLAAIAEDGMLALVDVSGCGYVLEAK